MNKEMKITKIKKTILNKIGKIKLYKVLISIITIIILLSLFCNQNVDEKHSQDTLNTITYQKLSSDEIEDDLLLNIPENLDHITYLIESQLQTQILEKPAEKEISFFEELGVKVIHRNLSYILNIQLYSTNSKSDRTKYKVAVDKIEVLILDNNKTQSPKIDELNKYTWLISIQKDGLIIIEKELATSYDQKKEKLLVPYIDEIKHSIINLFQVYIGDKVKVRSIWQKRIDSYSSLIKNKESELKKVYSEIKYEYKSDEIKFAIPTVKIECNGKEYWEIEETITKKKDKLTSGFLNGFCFLDKKTNIMLYSELNLVENVKLPLYDYIYVNKQKVDYKDKIIFKLRAKMTVKQMNNDIGEMNK